VILKHLHNVSNCGSLLTDSNVDAVKLLGVVVINEGALLVDDGVNSNSGLAGLSVTNDELSLASANGNLLFNNLLIKDSSFIII
jgi:hypothetical protein